MAGDEWPQWAVFPAHAGMSRMDEKQLQKIIGFPRSRGDEPMIAGFDSISEPFSPLTRG